MTRDQADERPEMQRPDDLHDKEHPTGETAAEATPPEQAAGAAEKPQTGPVEEAVEQAQLVVQLEADLAEVQNRALRAQAELENFRKRIYRQMEEDRKYALMPFLQDLLPVLDNLQRAIHAAEKHAAAGDSLLEGVRLVVQQWLDVFEKHHCTVIAAEGTLFDPHVHEAIAQFPHEEVPAGHVIQATETGYLLHDRVVRPSRVVVSAGTPPPTAEEVQEEQEPPDDEGEWISSS